MMEHYYFKDGNEEMPKQIFERAIDNVGRDMKAGEIWVKYIEFETSLNHMGFANLLCYLSIQTPLIDTELMV